MSSRLVLTNQRQFSMVCTLIDHNMFKTQVASGFTARFEHFIICRTPYKTAIDFFFFFFTIERERIAFTANCKRDIRFVLN